MAVGLGNGKSGTAIAKRSGGVVLPEGVELRGGQDARYYTFQQGPLKVAFDVIGRDGQASVMFEVNGNINRSRQISSAQRRDRVAIANRVRSIMRADAASRPDGFRYQTSAATGDGLGGRRASLYARAGFSRAREAGDDQFAVIRGGQMRPDNRRAAEEYDF